jgi:hypothetical protein
LFDIIGKQVKNLYGLAAVFGELIEARNSCKDHWILFFRIILGRYEMCYDPRVRKPAYFWYRTFHEDLDMGTINEVTAYAV